VCTLDKYIIRGGNKLEGEVTVSGAKNAAVAIIPAAVLVKGRCIIENVPKINDVRVLIEILRSIGAKTEFLDDTTLAVDCTNVNTHIVADREIAKKLRASYYFIGALLGRFHQAEIGMPGGCDFGSRPIDQHIKGFEALGATVTIENGTVFAKAEELVGDSIYLDVVSVGATINTMIAAATAKGMTVIENPAKEPHIVDVANFLNSMGADIRGAGTDVIKIKGVDELYGGTYAIIPDQIEAGSYMVAAAATGGRVTIRNVIPKHLDPISAKLQEAGVDIEEDDDFVTVSRKGPLTKVNVKTLPYPGFPTDLQPPMTAMLCLAKGKSIVNEGVYDNRFRYVDELRRMGAVVTVNGKICTVEGIEKFKGARVRACDLRGGVAMIIAGLCAEGVTEIEEIEYIERGYENIIEKFKNLGADIEKITVE